jgi:hypothetical protein
MNELNNESLLEAYQDAKKFELDQAFIQLLMEEIEARNMESYILTSIK